MVENNDNFFPNSRPITNTIVPFGKHKGKPVEALAQDRQYCDWLLTKDWFRDKHPTIYQIIINNFGEPSSTPEHNALQARFLDDRFCLALACLYKWIPIDKNTCLDRVNGELHNVEEQLSLFSVEDESDDDNSLASNYKRTLRVINGSESLKYNRSDLLANKKKFMEIKEYLDTEKSTFRLEKDFESKGWDVDINFHHALPNYWILDNNLHDFRISIEIKPSLGDDYPAILRQMKAVSDRISGSKCLVYDKFNAAGATLEQIKGIFSTAYFDVISIAEIEKM